MTDILTAFAGGAVLGFGSSLHCACMCGGVAAALMYLSPDQSRRSPLALTLQLQLGRVAAYSFLGGTAAGIAGLAFNPFSAAYPHGIMQWAAAAVLMWTGLSLAGLLPAISVPVWIGPGLREKRAFLSIRMAMSRMPWTLGAAWGLTPCPLVYTALILAALTGSATAGMAWMAGFGLGTLPAILASSMGLSVLARAKRSGPVRLAAGLSIAAFGLASVQLPWPALTALCAGALK